MKKRWFNIQVVISVRQLIFTFVAGMILFASCTPKNSRDRSLDKTFMQIDSLYLSGNLADMSKELDTVRNQIAANDIVSLGDYYYYQGIQSDEVSHKNNYADSALSLYPDIGTQLKYKEGYIKALTLKCWVFMYYKKYDDALEGYFKIRSLIDLDKYPVTYADYNSKIAQLYFDQHRYKLSASYNLIAYERLGKVKEYNPQYVFYLTQGSLNNAGFSYEKAEMLDSAAYLYHKGLAYLDEEEDRNVISKTMINASRIVFLDNLGGLTAKNGDFIAARELLEQSIAIESPEHDRGKTTAYIKLAHVYANLNQPKKADSLLKIAEQIINLNAETRYNLSLQLDKTKSDVLFLRKNYEEAYLYLKKYLEANDSVRRSTEQLASIDLRLTFESMQNKKDLAILAKTDRDKTLLLVVASLCLVLLTFIIILTNKNAKQARRAQKVSAEHSKQLEIVITQLENRNRDYAKIMKVMAHDLKDPLGAMVGISNFLLDQQGMSDKQKEMLKVLSDSGDNALDMINELLQSSLPIEKGGPAKEKVDLRHLLHQCTELFQYKADKKNQKIIFIGQDPVELGLSRERIWRVFNNLLANAIKFSPANGVIEVTLKKEGQSALIAIADQGIGVSQDHKQEIFEMFTRARRPGTAGEQSFGIGLSVCKQIVEEHRGKIWLEDNPSGGTIFYVSLPLI